MPVGPESAPETVCLGKCVPNGGPIAGVVIGLVAALGLSIWGCYMCCCRKGGCCCHNNRVKPADAAVAANAPQVVFVVQAPQSDAAGSGHGGRVDGAANAHPGPGQH